MKYVDITGKKFGLLTAVKSAEDLLLRYLFGDSCIYTGNDNSDYKEDMSCCADETVWDGSKIVPNPLYDAEHYDYFLRGIDNETDKTRCI